eukprot:140037-Chlamydomonas_euryale.AAC.3
MPALRLHPTAASMDGQVALSSPQQVVIRGLRALQASMVLSSGKEAATPCARQTGAYCTGCCPVASRLPWALPCCRRTALGAALLPLDCTGRCPAAAAAATAAASELALAALHALCKLVHVHAAVGAGAVLHVRHRRLLVAFALSTLGALAKAPGVGAAMGASAADGLTRITRRALEC